MAGRKPGTPKTGGRAKGTPNKVTSDVKELALQYTPKAMERLNQIAMLSESDAASVAAIKELFDRAYGKPKQSLDVDATMRIDWMQRAMEARTQANR